MTAPAPEFTFNSPAPAIAAMIAAIRPVDTEQVALADAPGRILAEPVLTDRPSPAVDVSAMDGYAVRLASFTAGSHPVSADITIGRRPPLMPPHGVLRIVTGAPVPDGADAVVKREDVEEAGDAIAISETSLRAIKPGMNIRRRAENAPSGTQCLPAGREIDAAVAGALASFGYPRPRVFRRLRVGILVTGDEVIEPSASPSPWQIRDSNGSALTALLGVPRWLDVTTAGRAADQPGILRDSIASLLESADAILITGGVSMGPKDFVPGVLESLKARILFHRIPQRPGKPVLGAILPGGRPVLALPGNPVSVMVTARRMAVPVLAYQGGRSPDTPPALVRLDHPDDRRLHLWWHRPVRLTAPGVADLVPGMGSGDVVSVAGSDGFIEVPPEHAGEGPWPYYSWRV